jgi:hypothetical protein
MIVHDPSKDRELRSYRMTMCLALVTAEHAKGGGYQMRPGAGPRVM